ncbi:MAG: DUF1566 domain-containing protein [Bacteroidia bacterium]|nr:DUF1566 domain-containing protein [Bacteroidia bacterium]NND51982.1 DUF1566 domain-containing protein [Flavobacteriaceae bacterium]
MKFNRIKFCCLTLAGTLLFMLSSCEKESINEGLDINEIQILVKAPSKVAVCHFDISDMIWKVININENALAGHLNHGDVLLVDDDEDGYVDQLNECVPGGDCDDTDPTINPGAAEICGNGVDDNCNGDIDEGCIEIGDFRDGGVVFWIDPNDNNHGLVCAIEDQGIIRWYNGSFIGVGSIGTEIGAGASNTDAIINVQGATETNYAAGLAHAYNGGGFTDWFLPSKDALNEMYINEAIINSTATANGGANLINYYYWSSSENSNSTAWEQDFTHGHQTANTKANPTHIRAVRAF